MSEVALTEGRARGGAKDHPGRLRSVSVDASGAVVQRDAVLTGTGAPRGRKGAACGGLGGLWEMGLVYSRFLFSIALT